MKNKKRDSVNKRINWLKEALAVTEKNIIMAELTHCRYHQGKTAERLGISQVTLHLKMKKHGLLRKDVEHREGTCSGNSNNSDRQSLCNCEACDSATSSRAELYL